MAGKRTDARRKQHAQASVDDAAGQEGRAEPTLARERIVVTAVELLDARGVAGLTMRELAERLGSGVMSLYWHVSNKEEVLDLALDLVLEPPHCVEFGNWREEVVHQLEDWRASMLRHPWSVSLLPRRALGPNLLSRLELLSRALSKAGVADADVNAAIWSLWNHLVGATITRVSFTLSDDDMAAGQRRLAQGSDRYKAIEQSRLLLDNDWDGAFRKGIDFLLDGFARAK